MAQSWDDDFRKAVTKSKPVAGPPSPPSYSGSYQLPTRVNYDNQGFTYSGNTGSSSSTSSRYSGYNPTLASRMDGNYGPPSPPARTYTTPTQVGNSNSTTRTVRATSTKQTAAQKKASSGTSSRTRAATNVPASRQRSEPEYYNSVVDRSRTSRVVPPPRPPAPTKPTWQPVKPPPMPVILQPAVPSSGGGGSSFGDVAPRPVVGPARYVSELVQRVAPVLTTPALQSFVRPLQNLAENYNPAVPLPAQIVKAAAPSMVAAAAPALPEVTNRLRQAFGAEPTQATPNLRTPPGGWGDESAAPNVSGVNAGAATVPYAAIPAVANAVAPFLPQVPEWRGPASYLPLAANALDRVGLWDDALRLLAPAAQVVSNPGEAIVRGGLDALNAAGVLEATLNAPQIGRAAAPVSERRPAAEPDNSTFWGRILGALQAGPSFMREPRGTFIPPSEADLQNYVATLPLSEPAGPTPTPTIAAPPTPIFTEPALTEPAAPRLPTLDSGGASGGDTFWERIAGALRAGPLFMRAPNTYVPPSEADLAAWGATQPQPVARYLPMPLASGEGATPTSAVTAAPQPGEAAFVGPVRPTSAAPAPTATPTADMAYDDANWRYTAPAAAPAGPLPQPGDPNFVGPVRPTAAAAPAAPATPATFIDNGPQPGAMGPVTRGGQPVTPAAPAPAGGMAIRPAGAIGNPAPAGGGVVAGSNYYGTPGYSSRQAYSSGGGSYYSGGGGSYYGGSSYYPRYSSGSSYYPRTSYYSRSYAPRYYSSGGGGYYGGSSGGYSSGGGGYSGGGTSGGGTTPTTPGTGTTPGTTPTTPAGEPSAVPGWGGLPTGYIQAFTAAFNVAPDAYYTAERGGAAQAAKDYQNLMSLWQAKTNKPASLADMVKLLAGFDPYVAILGREPKFEDLVNYVNLILAQPGNPESVSYLQMTEI